MYVTPLYFAEGKHFTFARQIWTGPYSDYCYKQLNQNQKLQYDVRKECK